MLIHPTLDRMKADSRNASRWLIRLLLIVMLIAVAGVAQAWDEAMFAKRPLSAFPVPPGRDTVVGELMSYRIRKGDTLLDIGRWYGLSAKEISDANNHIDWWAPPVGQEIILPTEHILPEAPHVGLVLNIPEMRIYYFPPPSIPRRRKHGVTSASYSNTRVVYTFPVGLGRFDWKTPVSVFKVTAKTHNPSWVLPEDIYQEHLERDGEADHVIPGGDPDNPLGHYRLSLSLPEYAIHGTNVPWGVGMTVSHGCVRLYPEDIDRLFHIVKVGTPGRFVYQPIKFGWRDNQLYVEVHDDLYGRYPGLWNLALHEVQRRGLQDDVDAHKLEKAVEAKTGIPTYVMPGDEPDTAGAPSTVSNTGSTPAS
ncbi:MAG: L,D-transpeptidase family protein [Candidatus Binataceae bacterium]|nr:L,D-transpeptidase family protein [Candidatus Binataceae bacterium]